MNTVTSYCPTCMDKYAKNSGTTTQEMVEKSKKTERGSGDWVVLIPNQESAHKLEQIAKLTSQSMNQLTGLSHAVDPYAASRFHLSLSSPLSILSLDEAGKLLTDIYKVIPEDLTFSSNMKKGKWNSSDDVFKLQFTGFNYPPHVTLTSTQAANSTSTFSTLMNNVNEIGVKQGLISPENADKQRRPHFTIGQVDESFRSKVHNTFYNCVKGDVNWTAHDKVVQDNAQYYPQASIKFSEVALLRVIREEGKPARYYKVASVSLDTNPPILTRYPNPQPWGPSADPTPENALKLVEQFVKEEYLSSPYFSHLSFSLTQEDNRFLIQEYDSLHGDRDYYTGGQLNEEYKDKRGNFDFAKALGQ